MPRVSLSFPTNLVSSLAAVHNPPSASWRWIATLSAAAAVGVSAASWQPTQPIRPGDTPSASPAAAAPAITAIAAQDPSRRIGVIVQLAPGVRAGDLVRAAGGRITMRLPIIGGVAAQVSAAGALRLATDAGVRHVSLDAPVRSSDDGNSGSGDVNASKIASAYTESIAANDAWNGQRATGKGIGVAVIDTGIAGDQADFKAEDGSSRVIASVVLNGGATTAGDRVGHGTHVAGLIAGNGLRRNGGLRGRYLGVAPDASLVSVKIADDHGETTLGDVINGLQFVLQFKDQLGIRVVNMSLNSTVAEPAATDPLDAAAEVVWANGVVVVAAAGNRGSAQDATWYAPANDPFVITVGAVDDQNTKRISDDLVPDWSSRGPTQDGTAKPDVVAPGAHLVSVLAPGSDYAAQCPACVVSGNYLQLGGTSMAAGVASGAIADVLQRHPDWTPDQVKGAVVDSARDLGDGPNEIRVGRGINQSGRSVANAGATPSTLLPARGDFASLGDWTRMSLSRMSLSRMSLSSVPPGDPLYAGWSRMSLSCVCSPPPADSSDASVDPSRMSLSRMSLSRMSLSTSFTK
jgi:serine protease AprX